MNLVQPVGSRTSGRRRRRTRRFGDDAHEEEKKKTSKVSFVSCVSCSIFIYGLIVSL
jgi:hypothetical protein